MFQQFGTRIVLQGIPWIQEGIPEAVPAVPAVRTIEVEEKRTGSSSGQDLLNPMQHPPVAIPISSLLNPAPQNAAPVENQSVNTSSECTVLHNNYKLTRKTTLSVVYCYPVDAVLEYPETGVDGGEVVGHLFAMKEDAWFSPSRDFAYSRGEPSGKAKETVTVPLLVDSVTGEPVPCITRHATCLGVKVCPYSDLQDAQNPHSSPTRSQVSQRCSASADEASSEILPSNMERLALRRGYPDVQNCCEECLVYSLSFEGTPYIKCEYHSRHSNRDHFFDNTIGNGRFDIEYLEALLTGDIKEVRRMELEAESEGDALFLHTTQPSSKRQVQMTWSRCQGGKSVFCKRATLQNEKSIQQPAFSEKPRVPRETLSKKLTTAQSKLDWSSTKLRTKVHQRVEMQEKGDSGMRNLRERTKTRVRTRVLIVLCFMRSLAAYAYVKDVVQEDVAQKEHKVSRFQKARLLSLG
ncbi:hypothetical protein BT96DRAFT_977114 [Gymnopus androsaceus JB14]|uniref:Uncharacterized protein n=1 Tax=Gymnopus androsaceus JB14 TaxID=1447944 RepID=A0A6A4HHA1_9AGAR|nr:hypothetical protein BT96DRAFT_977114 [Gymnopus androsaceus JB14]